MKIAVLQMTSGIDPEANVAVIEAAIVDAAAQGAAISLVEELKVFCPGPFTFISVYLLLQLLA